jgi:hypothetical protein
MARDYVRAKGRGQRAKVKGRGKRKKGERIASLTRSL